MEPQVQRRGTWPLNDVFSSPNSPHTGKLYLDFGLGLNHAKDSAWESKSTCRILTQPGITPTCPLPREVSVPVVPWTSLLLGCQAGDQVRGSLSFNAFLNNESALW